MRVLGSCLLLALACSKSEAPPPAVPNPEQFTLKEALEGLEGQGELRARIETSAGTVVVKLFEQQVPNTVANFVGLARGKKPFQDPKSGEWKRAPFYDGLTFHRVIPNFMIQGGCPLGQGTGGPGYKFADEIHPDLNHGRPGTLSMANAGRDTNGSQFFITDVPTPHLDGRHAVFGQVVEGLEVVQAIARSPAGPGNRPQTPIVMQKITIFRHAG